MTNAERFHKAHATAKQIRKCFSCYRDAFAFALTEVYAMRHETTATEPKWNAIEGRYFAKSDIANWAFRDDQIIRETEKALLVRLAVKYAGGVSIIKDKWLPKSLVKRGLERPVNEDGALDPDFDKFMELCTQVAAGERDLFSASKEYARFTASMYC